jgi:hypothetical protein
MIGLGHATKAQIFLESDAAWGTRVITTGSALELDDFALDADIGLVESRALYAGLSARALYQMGIKAAGSMALEARYEGMAKLLAMISGLRGAFVLSDTTVYTATFRVGKTAQGGVVAASLEVDEGGVYEASGDCAVATGLVVPRARFRINAGQGDDAMLRLECDLLAKDKVPQTTAQYTAGVPGASQTPVFFHESLDASFLDGTADAVAGVNVIGVEIEIVNPLTERYLIAPVSKNMQQPLRNGRVQVNWTIRKEFTTWSAYNKAKAHTDAALKLKCQSPVSIAGSAPDTKYSIEFSTTKAKALPPTHRINNWGIIEQTTRWRAYHDDTGTPDNGPLMIVVAQSKVSEDTLGA